MQREDEIRQGWRVYIPIDPSDVNREKARKTLANILEKDIRYDVPDQAEPGKEICVYMDYDLSRHQFVKTPEEYKDLLLRCWQHLASNNIMGIGYIHPSQSLVKLNSRAIWTPFYMTSTAYELDGTYRESCDPLLGQTLTFQELQDRHLSPESIANSKIDYAHAAGSPDAMKDTYAWEKQVTEQSIDDMKLLFLRIAQCDDSYIKDIAPLKKFIAACMYHLHGNDLMSSDPQAYEKLGWRQCELYWECLRTLALNLPTDLSTNFGQSFRNLVPNRPKVKLDPTSTLYKMFQEVENPKKLRESRLFFSIQHEPLRREEQKSDKGPSSQVKTGPASAPIVSYETKPLHVPDISEPKEIASFTRVFSRTKTDVPPQDKLGAAPASAVSKETKPVQVQPRAVELVKEKTAIEELIHLINSDVWETRHRKSDKHPENKKVAIGIAKLRTYVKQFKVTDEQKFLDACRHITKKRQGYWLSAFMKKRRYPETDQFYRLLWDCKTVEALEARKDALKALDKPEQPTAQQTPTH